MKKVWHWVVNMIDMVNLLTFKQGPEKSAESWVMNIQSPGHLLSLFEIFPIFSLVSICFLLRSRLNVAEVRMVQFSIVEVQWGYSTRNAAHICLPILTCSYRSICSHLRHFCSCVSRCACFGLFVCHYQSGFMQLAKDLIDNWLLQSFLA